MAQHNQKWRKGNLIKCSLAGILEKKKKKNTQHEAKQPKPTGSLYTYNNWRLQKTQKINTS